jgi:hypothetical protein
MKNIKRTYQNFLQLEKKADKINSFAEYMDGEKKDRTAEAASLKMKNEEDELPMNPKKKEEK